MKGTTFTVTILRYHWKNTPGDSTDLETENVCSNGFTIGLEKGAYTLGREVQHGGRDRDDLCNPPARVDQWHVSEAQAGLWLVYGWSMAGLWLVYGTRTRKAPHYRHHRHHITGTTGAQVCSARTSSWLISSEGLPLNCVWYRVILLNSASLSLAPRFSDL